jgi:hypothetical protein
MCTITFWPRTSGYCVGMNRDEQRTRVTALPPQRRETPAGAILCPHEPSGGTWVSTNTHGITLGLVNNYSVPRVPIGTPVSRGKVVETLAPCRSRAEAEDLLRTLSLAEMAPFRLVGFFPGNQEIWEWRWDTQRLDELRCRWSPNQWISSSVNEPKAQQSRTVVFRTRCGRADAGSIEWMRSLHGSHAPLLGPFSTCMHRQDAITVSYTEIEVDQARVAMRYHPGPPCELRGKPPGGGTYELQRVITGPLV